MARSELAIATMSTTSCSSAPMIAGMMPKAAMSISTIDSAMPTQIDSLATRRVRRPTDTATAAREMSSRTITTSAVSEAAVEPRAPIAMPTSDTARTGASLTPSPTIITGRGSTSWTRRTLSSGSRSAWTSSMPAWAAMCRAVSSASPVSITLRPTPCRSSSARVAVALARRRSERIRVPANAPSMPM